VIMPSNRGGHHPRQGVVRADAHVAFPPSG